MTSRHCPYSHLCGNSSEADCKRVGCTYYKPKPKPKPKPVPEGERYVPGHFEPEPIFGELWTWVSD